VTQFKTPLGRTNSRSLHAGSMTALFPPWALAAACVLIIPGLLISSNATLWAAGLLTIPIAVWLLGGGQAYRVLLWVIAVNWLQVIGDVASADLTGSALSDGWLGSYRVEAIVFSLCAILALALGMRWGTQLGGWMFRARVQIDSGSLGRHERAIGVNRVVICYFIALPVTSILASVGNSVPGLTQPFHAMILIKFVCLYLIAARVFESGRGYVLLTVISLLEIVIGLTGFFSAYKEAFIVMLIAMASSRRAVSARMLIFSATAVVMVIWISLVWTSIKKEYRHEAFGTPIEYRIEWMGRKFFVDSIDYHAALVKLSERIGYTEYYARIMARESNVSYPGVFYFYASAVRHVLTPRILFPDKPSLNDSKLTTALLSIKINEGTSIGVGYVAQAYVDFGFPGLLLPILSIGVMIGWVAKYFMTRFAPLLVREAFTTATIFLSFLFETDIDKALGGFITGFLAMALALKFAYPILARWLTESHSGWRTISGGYVKNAEAPRHL
jgi:hypothetical protein